MSHYPRYFASRLPLSQIFGPHAHQWQVTASYTVCAESTFSRISIFEYFFDKCQILRLEQIFASCLIIVMDLLDANPDLTASQDLLSYVLDHNDYDASRSILIDACSEDQYLSISRSEAGKLVNDVIHDFEAMKISSGKTICVHMFNHILYPILFLSILGAGCQFSGSNPGYTTAELTHHLKLSNADVVITEESHMTVVGEAAAECRIPTTKVLLLKFNSSAPQSSPSHHGHVNRSNGASLPPSLPSLWKRGKFNEKETAKKTPAMLCSTSGTTGLPKMAVRSHYALISEHLAIVDTVQKDYEVRRLVSAPFFHAFAGPLVLIDALKTGVETYIMRRFNMQQFLEAIDKFDITETMCPPPVLIRLHALPEKTREPLKRLRKISTGGACLSSDMQSKMIKMFHPEARIVQTWGMTEGGWFTTFHYPEHDTTGAVGRFLPGYSGKVIDDDGNEVPFGQSGEIVVRGPGSMLGYLDNEEATATMFTQDGYMRTGDIGHVSEDGKVYVLDRKKELIKVRGWQVSPQELEARLLAHQDIVDAAVIGTPLPTEGSEMPYAFVVCTHPWAKDPTKSDELISMIKTYLLKYLARYKVGECCIRFLEEIPKSATGKILKRELRKMVEEENTISAVNVSNKMTG